MEQLGCYGSLAPLPNVSLGAFPCEREEKGKRKARPKSRDTYGSKAEQRKAAGLFFHAAHHQPEHARTARNGARQQAAAAARG